MCDLSILIPVYNAARYLDDCLGSVTGQTLRNLEVILVDDGSTDGSAQRCEDWVRKDARVRCIHQQNAGAAAARNRAVLQARGSYLLFLDSDDFYLEPDVLEKLWARLQERGADVLSFNYCKVFPDAISPPYFSQGDLDAAEDGFGAIARQELWVSSPWNKAIRRSLFACHDLAFREGVTAEDIDWCVRLALAAPRHDYTGLCVVGYRKLNDSVSGSMNQRKLQCLLRGIGDAVACADANPQRGPLLQPYLGYQVATLVYNLALMPELPRELLCGEALRSLLPRMGASHQPKARLLCASVRLLGLPATVRLLKTFVIK